MSEPPSPWLLLAAAPLNSIDSSLVSSLEALRLLGGVGLLALSAFFTAGLSALSKIFPLNPNNVGYGLEGMRKEVMLKLLGRPLHALASVQLGRSLSTLAFAWLVAPPLYRLVATWLGTFPGSVPLGILITLILLATLYVTVVQRFVKTLADADADKILHVLAVPLRVWQVATLPLTTLVLWLANPLLRLLGINQERTLSKTEMLKRLVGESLRATDLDEEERRLLTNVFDFSETVAGELMVPRPDVAWVSTDSSLEQVLARVTSSGHTRLPVCEGSPDKVIGYLHAKDLTAVRASAFDLRTLVRPVAFVPESARAMMLLKRFKQERAHLAVVVDEFGGMAGVLTFEDLLEELVGDIRDEFDLEEPDMEALENGEWIVDGGVRLEELEETLLISFGDVEEETVGGYIFGRLAREVEVGEELTVEGAILRVEAVEGLRVTRVRITPTPSEPEKEPPPDDETRREDEVLFTPREVRLRL